MEDRRYPRKEDGRRSRRKKKKGGLKIFLFILEFIVLIVMLALLFVFVILPDKVTQDLTLVQTEEALQINDQLGEMEEIATETGEDWNMAEYTTVALFGVDARNRSLGKGNRSDTIMIVALNNSTYEVRLISMYRDTYCNIGNDTYNKANTAYSQGGPEQAIQMLNTCLDLDIKDYVSVDFYGLIDAIDALGGVDIDVKEAEIEHLNNYQISMAGEEDGLNLFGETQYKATEGEDYIAVKKSGMQHLNGLQATAYCRIRYVGNDFERTNRQRAVLGQVLKRAASVGPLKLNEIIDSVGDKVQTSFSAAEMIDYAADITKYNMAEGAGFPFENVTGNMGKAGSCVVAKDFAADVKMFHTLMYGEDSYAPTERVKEISAKIDADRSKYLGK